MVKWALLKELCVGKTQLMKLCVCANAACSTSKCRCSSQIACNVKRFLAALWEKQQDLSSWNEIWRAPFVIRSEAVRQRSYRNSISAPGALFTDVVQRNPFKVSPGWVYRAPRGTPLVAPGRRPECWQLPLSGSLYQASAAFLLLLLWHTAAEHKVF